MTQTSKKLEEIIELSHDCAELNCYGKHEEAKIAFKTHIKSLLQEIREEVIGFPEFPIKDPSPNERLIGSIVEQQRKNLKSIEERWLIQEGEKK